MKDVSVNDGRTVLFVSHDLNAVAQLCTHGIMLKYGKVWYNGNTHKMISEYLNFDKQAASYENPRAVLTKNVAISRVQVENENAEITKVFQYDAKVIVKFRFVIKDLSANPDFFVTILDSKKKRVFSCEINSIKENLRLIIEPEFLVRGEYSIHAFVNVPKIEQLDVAEDICSFKVIDSGSYLSKHGDYDYGSVFGKYKWE
jgi:lipopolysaccharide transport system ATP-binding protein